MQDMYNINIIFPYSVLQMDSIHQSHIWWFVLQFLLGILSSKQECGMH